MKRHAAVENRSDGLLFGGLVAVIALLPVVVYRQDVLHISPTLTGFTTQDTSTFSNAYMPIKFSFLLLLTLGLLAAFTYRTMQKSYTLEPSETHIPLALLWGLTLLSQLASPYPTIALFGMYNLREGTLTFLSCLLLMLFAVHTAVPRERQRWFVYALVPFTVANLLLGLFFFFKVKVLNWAPVKALIYPPTMKEVPAGHWFPTTLGNQNYASGLGAICTVIFLMMALLARGARERVAMLLLAWSSYTIVLTSQSQSGFVALVMILPVVAFLAWRYAAERRRALAVGLVALAGFAAIYLGLYLKDPRVFQETFKLPSISFRRAKPPAPPKEKPELPVLPKPGQSWGTGRGYIWEKTVEVIARRPLLGYGLDTLAYGFPQHDPGKLAGIGSYLNTTNKPHSVYLGIAYGLGVPALLAFAALVLIVLWRHVKAIWSGIPLDPVHLALLAGWLAYLVQGLVNDSVVGYSAVFWIFLGATVSMLRAAGARALAAPAGARRAG